MAINQDLMIELKNFIDDYYSQYSLSPSVRTIANKLGVGKSTVQRYIDKLRDSGELTNSSVGVVTREVEKMLQPSQTVGLVGSISCGPLTFAQQNITEYFKLPTSLIGKGEFFMLQASGNSMIDAGIDDGDLVIVKKQSTAKDGDIVVALYEDSTTLKRFYKDTKNQRFILHPENEELEDIIVEGELYIQGVATKVLKDLI